MARTGNAFLRSKLQTPLTHQFLTKLLFCNMWTKENILSFENAVKIPPIYKKIKELLPSFKERLEASNKEDLNENFYVALRNVLLKFEKGGEFAEDYMRPKDIDLAMGMMDLFKKTVADCTITHDEPIVLEYSGYVLLKSQEETKAWVNGFFDTTNLYMGKHDSNYFLCLFTHEQHPVMVHVSLFEIFAEDTRTTTRYNNGQALYQQYCFLQDAKIITDNHANNERAKILAAMMQIHASDNNDENVEGGGYREARILYSPEGYFLRNKKDVTCVLKNIGNKMKVNILLGIAYCLGETAMSQLLITVYNMPAETPLYAKSFCCPDLMETKSRPSQSCPINVVGLDKENQPYFSYCVTTGGFFCKDCNQNSSQYSRELEILNKLKAHGGALSALQEKRYALLDTRRIKRNIKQRNDRALLQQQQQSRVVVYNSQSNHPRETFQYLYEYQQQHHQPGQQQQSGSFIIRHWMF